jgi:hypothetical protein
LRDSTASFTNYFQVRNCSYYGSISIVGGWVDDHDENKNGKCDTGLFGIPTEGTVVSNHPKGFMGPPSFDKAKFSFAGVSSELKVRMGY